MLTTLRQVYSKHSPTFIVSLLPFVFALILLLLHPLSTEKEGVENNQCIYSEKIKYFELMVAITMGTELILRSIGISIIYKLSREATTTMYTIFFFLFFLAHATLWVYSLILYFNQEFYYGCQYLQPHFFFIKSYAFVYGVMVALGTVVIVVLALPALVLTIKSFKRRNESNV